jgi:hypothetical protein
MSPFTKEALRLDAAQEVTRIEAAIREGVFSRLKRRGVVVGLVTGTPNLLEYDRGFYAG